MNDNNDPDTLDVNNVTIDTSTITLETGTHTWVSGEDEFSLTYAGYIEVEEDALVFVKINNPALHSILFDGNDLSNVDRVEAITDENNEQNHYWERVSGDGITNIEQVYIKYDAADATIEYEYESVYMPNFDVILMRDDEEPEYL